MNLIIKEDADIILLQEVRIDSTFRNPSNPMDYGGQADHILQLLQQLSHNNNNNNQSLNYHTIYQPGMLQFNQ